MPHPMGSGLLKPPTSALHSVAVTGTSRPHHHGLCCTKESSRALLLILYRPHRIHSTSLSLYSLEGGKEQAKRKLPRQESPRDVSRSQA